MYYCNVRYFRLAQIFKSSKFWKDLLEFDFNISCDHCLLATLKMSLKNSLRAEIELYLKLIINGHSTRVFLRMFYYSHDSKKAVAISNNVLTNKMFHTSLAWKGKLLVRKLFGWGCQLIRLSKFFSIIRSSIFPGIFLLPKKF